MVANHHELIQGIQSKNIEGKNLRNQALNEAKMKERH